MSKTYINYSYETLSVIQPTDIVNTGLGISICLTKQPSRFKTCTVEIKWFHGNSKVQKFDYNLNKE